jgi:hypothetical protein
MSVSAGELWAVPLSGTGSCPLVIACGPSPMAGVDFALAYLRPDLQEQPPAEVPPVAEWGSAWVGLVVMRPFRNERWIRCGDVARFDPAD